MKYNFIEILRASNWLSFYENEATTLFCMMKSILCKSMLIAMDC